MDFSKIGTEEEVGLTQQTYLNPEEARTSIEQYRAAILEMEKQASAYEVTNEETAQQAVDMTKETKDLYNKVENQRKQFVAEPNKFVKSINAFAKSFTEKLLGIERMLKKKIGDYQYRQEFQRREEEKRAREEAEKLQKQIDQEAKEKGVESVTVAAPVLLKKKPVVRSESASASIRTKWKAEVLNPDEIERQFCSPDMKKIQAAVDGGLREIKGCRVFEDVITAIR